MYVHLIITLNTQNNRSQFCVVMYIYSLYLKYVSPSSKKLNTEMKYK